MNTLSLNISIKAYRIVQDVEAVVSWVKNQFKNLSTESEFKKTIRELQALSDRELVDIGITRCDIREIARQSANRSK